MRNTIRQKIVDALAAPVPTFTRRDVRLPRITGKVTAVVGIRRAGKTTLLWQVLADRLAAGWSRERLLYFSFEDERLAGMTTADLQLVVEEYYRLCPEWRERRRTLFLMDEIQNVPGWQVFVRRLQDSEKMDIFVSGSSAKLLGYEVATSLRGRALVTLVHPFSFREYLRHHGSEPRITPERLTKAERSVLERDLRQYLVAGGFPEAQGVAARDRFDLLRSYVDVALFRDVVERHAVSHPLALRWMARYLLGNAAGLFSVNRFHGDLRAQGIGVAKDTLHAYLGYLEDAFLVRTVALASGSERRRMVNPRKVYPVDPGLIPVYDRTGQLNLGHALETCVMLELERRGAEIAYVRTGSGYEVDFLARFPGGDSELIQVCADLDSPGTWEREIRALIEAGREHPHADRLLISLDPEIPHRAPAGIHVQTAASWLCRKGEV